MRNKVAKPLLKKTKELATKKSILARTETSIGTKLGGLRYPVGSQRRIYQKLKKDHNSSA